MSCEFLESFERATPLGSLPDSCRQCVAANLADPDVETEAQHGDFGDEFSVTDVRTLSETVVKVGGTAILSQIHGATGPGNVPSIYSRERTPITCIKSAN